MGRSKKKILESDNFHEFLGSIYFYFEVLVALILPISHTYISFNNDKFNTYMLLISKIFENYKYYNINIIDQILLKRIIEIKKKTNIISLKSTPLFVIISKLELKKLNTNFKKIIEYLISIIKHLYLDMLNGVSNEILFTKYMEMVVTDLGVEKIKVYEDVDIMDFQTKDSYVGIILTIHSRFTSFILKAVKKSATRIKNININMSNVRISPPDQDGFTSITINQKVLNKKIQLLKIFDIY